MTNADMAGFGVQGLRDIGIAPCMNGIKDGNESDVDCGGTVCGGCAVGKSCGVNADCLSMSCVGGKCAAVASGCGDATKDGMETDVDCGGPSCGPCADGKGCALARDCQDGSCIDGVCGQAQPCMDGTKDGMETDVDCGGPSCPQCGDGKACMAPSDCTSGNCDNAVCSAANAQCADGKKDGNETDVDCGGGLCPKCADGKSCQVAPDCVGGACTNGVCGASSSCTDGMKNGDETDVDCGGGICPKCVKGQGCKVNQDCLNGTCNSGYCA